jgi:FtsP/CotA-like multicopper oxidase with cupredoxin domain/3-polyprenyl-4-hydroxybenzoate decarboxylase
LHRSVGRIPQALMLLSILSSVLPGAPVRAASGPVTARSLIAPPLVTQRAVNAVRRLSAAGATLLSEAFTASTTTANLWKAFGDACLTAGTAATPASSIKPCGATAPVDAAGSGALELTQSGGSRFGMAIAATPLSTANGLQITFNDYAFHGTTPGSEGVALFLTDASKPLPVAPGQAGGGMGYAGTSTGAGVANGYVGVGFDEFGSFSNTAGGFNGGPGIVPETIAVRGSAATQYQYIGGVVNATGKAASLPFAFDQPALTTRPAVVPTVTVTLTSAGVLSAAVDRHDGNGSVTYYTQSIVGVGGQPAVPANVYVGLSGSTGVHYNVHQVSALTVKALNATTTALVSETFTGASTAPNAWKKFGDSCLTAGTAATPTTSLPACGTTAPADVAGAGALQLTTAAGSQVGAVVYNTPLPTAKGLQITFTDYAFNGAPPGSEGVGFFFTDASQPFPSHSGLAGGGVGYSGTTATSGLPSAYVGVAMDERGSFSSPSGGFNGGPGIIPETIAARGAASTNYQYLGGVTNSSGAPASLPFPLDQPTATTRPATAPTIQGTLLPSGQLTVAIDRHDGAGFKTYYSQSIVGVGGQPAVPANVYFGLSGSTGTHFVVHQVSGLVVTAAGTKGSPPSADNPPQLVSANGTLAFNVSATANSVTGNPQFTYNGLSIAPTLRLLPGDTLTVNFTNFLPRPPSGAGYTNNTNLHYHGLHVSPLAPADDSIDMLATPGQVLHYTVHIPANHPPGLYWYHTHAHGEAERQTLSGMSGAIIIDGIASYTPQVTGLTERVLIARDTVLPGIVLPNANLHQIYAMKWAMAHGVAMQSSARTASSTRAASVEGMGMPGMPTVSGTAAGASADHTEYHAASSAQTRNPYVTVDTHYRRFVRPLATSTHCLAGNPEAPVKALTLNGLSQPSIRIAPGEQQFWRLVNAGADTYLDVQVDNTQMQIIALDGVPLISGVGTPASMTVSHWVLPPSSRVEFIVTGPPAGTAAYLRTNCFDSGSAGDAMPAALLASINPAAATAAIRSTNRVVARLLPTATRYRFHRSGFRTAAGIRSAAVSATRTIFYTDQNNINGVAYDPAAPPQFYAQSGTVEEWTIQNSSNQVHTFHIHQIHFVVEAINGITQSQQYVMDNVNVPAASASGPGSVKLLLDFTDSVIIGTFLLHCHILSHEDGGMMAKIRIGTAPPLGLSASSVTFASATAALQSVTVSGGAAPYSVTGCTGVASAAVSGTAVSIAPTAAGSCVLIVADSSNPSLTATVAVQVNAGPAVVALAPKSVSFTGPTAAAQTVAIAGGTAPYTAAGCKNVAAETVSGAVLTVSPLAVGTCSLVVTDAQGNTATLAVTVNSSTVGNPLDNLTFHQNAMRLGWYQNEKALTTANVASASFGKIGTLIAPAGMTQLGKVYAQPLYATNEKAADGNVHNLLVVASANDQVYAFDETTQAVVWHRDFTNAAAGIRQQLWSDTTCSDVNPDVGIVGTPVIDRTRDAIYVVVATVEHGVPFTRLHAIGLGNGNDLIAPTVITGSVALASGGTATVNSLLNMNRSALLEANGNIYVALGSHCDQNASTTHGWVIAYSASTLAETGNLVDLSNANDGSGFFLGSVWMGGFGPAADASGNVYFATGNGPFNGTSNFAMSIMRLPGNLDLTAASYFAPIQEAADSAVDLDLGSGGVLLLPDQGGLVKHILVGGGKCSSSGTCLKYLLNRDVLGGQRASNAGALWSANTGGDIFGGPAYFVDASGAQHIIYGGSPLSTYTLGLAPIGLSIQSSANVGCLECRDGGSQPIVSSNGTLTGTGIVWALKTPGNNGGTISLYAFDALNMSHTLFTGPAGNWTKTAAASWLGGALISPLVVNGRVYVPSDGGVTVFGLH